jgi:hypothetical protein
MGRREGHQVTTMIACSHLGKLLPRPALAALERSEVAGQPFLNASCKRGFGEL